MKELENQLREHNQNSSTLNGRINIAHTRKKKRLDEDFEKILNEIELKRCEMNELDDISYEKSRCRNLKENDMAKFEKQIVLILIEQQQAVLKLIEEGKETEGKCRGILKDAMLPWPPLQNPTAKDIADIFGEKKNAPQKADESVSNKK